MVFKCVGPHIVAVDGKNVSVIVLPTKSCFGPFFASWGGSIQKYSQNRTNDKSVARVMYMAICRMKALIRSFESPIRTCARISDQF